MYINLYIINIIIIYSFTLIYIQFILFIFVGIENRIFYVIKLAEKQYNKYLVSAFSQFFPFIIDNVIFKHASHNATLKHYLSKDHN